MSKKCASCGTDIITFEYAKEMNYRNAAPWLRLLVFKVVGERDDAVYQFDFCCPLCLAKWADAIAGTTRPIYDEPEVPEQKV